MPTAEPWEVIIVGAGLAGLSAAVYLGRSLRTTLLIDDHQSLALWEPEVQNYLGFPKGIAGQELLSRGRQQAEAYGAHFASDTVQAVKQEQGHFLVTGKSGSYSSRRLLLATGLYHLPPDISGVQDCLGHSMFFCKDCDAYRVQEHRLAIIGRNNEAVDYALGMLLYSACVIIATNGKGPTWDTQHARWVEEYQIPIFPERITEVEHDCGKVYSLVFADQGRFAVDSIFTTRGDIYHNSLAQHLGADLDQEGQIVVDEKCRTSVPGLYAAGCVTTANCQMIIAAGQGATAGQSINRDLFEESLASHSLRRFRQQQVKTEQILPEPVSEPQ